MVGRSADEEGWREMIEKLTVVGDGRVMGIVRSSIRPDFWLRFG